MVINVDKSYSVLLGRPWMHKNAAVPSTYHQCVKYPLRETQGTITTDNDSFSTIETYHADCQFYKANGKGKVNYADVSSTISVRHPLAGFTRPITPLKCGTINAYHRFEVPKKGGTKKPIIFHASGDMVRHGEHKGESSSSASCGVSESQRSPESNLIREGMGKDFRRAKDREGIPPFEAMLIPEQRKALYSGAEMPKDRKGLGYRYQVMMVTIEPPKGSPRLSESHDKDI